MLISQKFLFWAVRGRTPNNDRLQYLPRISEKSPPAISSSIFIIYIRKINDIRSLSKYSISNIAQGDMDNDYTIKPALVTYRGAKIDELLRMTWQIPNFLV